MKQVVTSKRFRLLLLVLVLTIAANAQITFRVPPRVDFEGFDGRLDKTKSRLCFAVSIDYATVEHPATITAHYTIRPRLARVHQMASEEELRRAKAAAARGGIAYYDEDGELTPEQLQLGDYAMLMDIRSETGAVLDGPKELDCDAKLHAEDFMVHRPGVFKVCILNGRLSGRLMSLELEDRQLRREVDDKWLTVSYSHPHNHRVPHQRADAVEVHEDIHESLGIMETALEAVREEIAEYFVNERLYVQSIRLFDIMVWESYMLVIVLTCANGAVLILATFFQTWEVRNFLRQKKVA